MIGFPSILAFAGMTRLGELFPHNPRLANLAYAALVQLRGAL
jgi:hypothetical protein